MTAHAMKGDEEKCLRAGMNAYVSKPINQDRMFHTLWKSIGPFRQPPEAETAEPVSASEPETEVLPDNLPGINIGDTLANLNIDQAAFRRILQGFYFNNRDTFAKIKAALEGEDWGVLRQIAHSLKGSAANIGAESLHMAAKNLEGACSDETLRPPSAQVIDNLETAMDEVFRSLESLLILAEGKVKRQEKVAMGAAQVLPAIYQLSEALEMADPESIHQYMQSVRRYLNYTTLQQLENHINNYEYDEALEVLKQIEEHLQISSSDRG